MTLVDKDLNSKQTGLTVQKMPLQTLCLDLPVSAADNLGKEF